MRLQPQLLNPVTRVANQPSDMRQTIPLPTRRLRIADLSSQIENRSLLCAFADLQSEICNLKSEIDSFPVHFLTNNPNIGSAIMTQKMIPNTQFIHFLGRFTQAHKIADSSSACGTTSNHPFVCPRAGHVVYNIPSTEPGAGPNVPRIPSATSSHHITSHPRFLPNSAPRIG